MPQNRFRKKNFLNSTSEQKGKRKMPFTASCVKEYRTFYISHQLLRQRKHVFMIHFHTHIAEPHFFISYFHLTEG